MNRVIATVKVSGEACSGLASGFGSIWVPVCGKKPALVRIDAAKNTIFAILPIPPAGPEGGIATSEDSVWMVTDKDGTLTRIDPSVNNVRQNKVVKQWVGKGGDSLRVGFGSIWITDYKRGLLERIPIQQLLTQ